MDGRIQYELTGQSGKYSALPNFIISSGSYDFSNPFGKPATAAAVLEDVEATEAAEAVSVIGSSQPRRFSFQLSVFSRHHQPRRPRRRRRRPSQELQGCLLEKRESFQFGNPDWWVSRAAGGCLMYDTL